MSSNLHRTPTTEPQPSLCSSVERERERDSHVSCAWQESAALGAKYRCIEVLQQRDNATVEKCETSDGDAHSTALCRSPCA